SQSPSRVTVKDEFTASSSFFQTSVLEGGVLYGALTRLQDSSNGFKFTVKIDPNLGLYLESVNGVAGSEAKHTYWQILSEHDGTVTKLDVGKCCPQSRKWDNSACSQFSRWIIYMDECIFCRSRLLPTQKR
uniref:Uncharacterized protein n=1 Tax=Astyanax mexicanus TaxID=7994 RepID=A0A3B1JUY3_ASTMX